MTDGGSRGSGLLASGRGLLRTLVEIAQTRLALAASDLEEQASYFARIVVCGIVCAIGAFCALVMAIVFVIVAAGEHRLIAVGILFAVFFAAALWAFAALRRLLADRPKLLAATLAELEKDKAALSAVHEIDR